MPASLTNSPAYFNRTEIIGTSEQVCRLKVCAYVLY